jgi:hypothetical protein
MRHPRLRPWLLTGAALGTLALVLTTSCSQQQEGERCDRNNGISGGDSDCNDGLECTAAKDLQTDTDRCCPHDRSQATVAPCIVSASSLTQDASPPATDATTNTTDGSMGTDSGTDSGSDTGTDTGVSDASDSG